MGVGPIPISEVKAYCDLMRMDSEFETERLVHLISVADGVYLEETNKSKKEPKPQARRPRRR